MPSSCTPSNRLSSAPCARAGAVGGPTARRLESLWGVATADDLSVVFQPIVSLTSGEPRAYEALLRSDAPTIRSPAVLFERAATLGCSGWLGRLVRETSLPLARGVPVFINVHPTELCDDWLVRDDDPIYAHDADVFLELTESTMLRDSQRSRQVLAELASRGAVFLVVDDLGAGCSNLRGLVELEPRVVKLDRALVVDLHRQPNKRILVEAIVELCDRLGAEVVAEGVEQPEELEALLDAGVGYGQGYLFARPGYPLPEVHWPPVDRITVVPPADS